jgi:major membrane immunogen (membrane-anchored lipoprotein)
MKKRLIAVILTLISTLMVLAGCNEGNSAYKDGIYTGKSSKDERGAFGEAMITIDDNEITDCQYITWQKDGTVKDENYGKVNGEISNQDYYRKAQLAVNAMKQYAEKLVEVQKLEDVDAVSGATIAYDQFSEAVENALNQAKK